MVGRTLVHYEILEKLGSGGMGDVYRARDTKLNREVALKVLPSEMAQDPQRRKRFAREAQAIAALKHPNVVMIHSAEETEDVLFLIMELVEGKTLADLIPDHGLSLEHLFELAIPLADAVAGAHDAGITHRDLKPANVMVGQDGRIKVLDFGLAKLMRDEGQDVEATRALPKEPLTGEGMIVGTVPYMSPEQVRGQEVDSRTDIFSLGILLYEMSTGHRPFDGETASDVTSSILRDAPLPVISARPDMPRHLGRIVERCLEKNPEDRYQSAKDIRNDLSGLRKEIERDSATDRAAVTASPSRSDGAAPPRNTPPKNRLLRGLLAAAGIAVIGVAGWAFLQRSQTPSAPPEMAVAVVDFQDLGNPDDNVASAGMMGLVHVGLMESSPCRVVSPVYLLDLRRRLFGAARGPIGQDQALEVARESGATMLLTGQMVPSGTDQYVTWQMVDTQTGKSLGAKRVEGKDLALLADGIIAGVLPFLASSCEVEMPDLPPPVTSMTTNFPEAYDHYVAGKLADEEGQPPEDVIRELEKAVQIDSTFALAAFELGLKYQHQYSELGKAKELTDRAWRHKDRLGVKDRMRLETWQEQRGGRTRAAIATYREMLTRWPDDKNILSDLSRVLGWWWYFDEAMAANKQGLDLYPDDAGFASEYAWGLRLTGKPQSALEIVKGMAEQNPSSPNIWDDMGLIYLDLGMTDSARVAFTRALEIDPGFVYSQQGLADCRYQRGDVDGAIESLEAILERADLLPAQRIEILTYHGAPSLMWYHQETGRFQRALEIVEEARNLASGPEMEHELDGARGKVWWSMEQYEEILRWSLEKAERADSPSRKFNALATVAGAWSGLDSLDRARSTVHEALSLEEELGPLVLQTYRVVAEIALAEGDSEAAMDALEMLRRHGQLPVATYAAYDKRLSARAHRMAGRLDTAETELKDVLRIFGGHALAHYELGQVYEEMGRPEDAEHEYTAFLDAWKNADAGLPRVEDARQRRDALRAQLP